MICTRCGTVQRRETARFCHLCGAQIEPAAAEVQLDSAEIPTLESAPQPAQPFKPIALLPRESGGSDAAEVQPTESDHPESPGFVADKQIEHERYADEATLKTPAVASPGQAGLAMNQALPQLTVDAPGWEEPPTPPRMQQEGRHYPRQATRGSSPQPSVWPQEQASADERLEAPPGHWNVGAAVSQASIFPERLQQASAGEYHRAGAGAKPLGDPRSPTTQNRRTSPTRASLEARDGAPAIRRAASAERPLRSTARGPVPGSLSRPRRARRRRLPLGIIITLGLVLVFILAGLGIYALVTSTGSTESSAFLTYSDPGHHFSIQYPNVWSIQKPTNGAHGVRFTDATDTAELWVTYTTSSPTLTVAQFADQEAANAGIATPAPDMDTFAGATWVVRSGVVTQTSGISQQILLYVTLHNNVFFEVRKVAPLNNYPEPNQAAFMPMLQSLTLM